jgi:hypothetical protein
MSLDPENPRPLLDATKTNAGRVLTRGGGFLTV